MRIAVFGGWQIIDNKHMESTEARRLDSASRPMQDGADKSQTGWAGRLDYMWCDASSIAHLNLDSRRAREHAGFVWRRDAQGMCICGVRSG
jgi:hypothetical protein